MNDNSEWKSLTWSLTGQFFVEVCLRVPGWGLWSLSSSLTNYVSGCARTKSWRYDNIGDIWERYSVKHAARADELIERSQNNRINCKKTKEMILWPLSKELLTPLLIAAKPVQRVTEYKLLGVTVNATLKWDDHVNAITSKAAKRLCFLNKLKWAGVDKQYLLHFFLTVIRPVLEYACPAWHTSLKQHDYICIAGKHSTPRSTDYRRQHPIWRCMLSVQTDFVVWKTR